MPRKKGFWIKKDGTIAVDISSTPVERATETRLRNYIAKKKPAQKVYIQGKGTRALKEIVIPHLKLKCENERKYKRLARAKLHRVEGEANKLIKVIRKQYKAKVAEERKRIYSKLNTWANRKAIQVNKNMIRSMYQSRRGIYSALFGFPIISNYCKKTQTDPKVLMYLLMVSFYKVYYIKYSVAWGFQLNIKQLSTYNSKLRRLGYIEPFIGKRGAYVLSLKGMEYIKLFDYHYRKMVRDALKTKIDGGEPKPKGNDIKILTKKRFGGYRG